MKNRKKIKGIVVSNKMNKTVVVLITKFIKHKIYGKYIKKSIKIYAHDELNQYKIGDLVEIVETSPYSKKKSWKVYNLLN